MKTNYKKIKQHIPAFLQYVILYLLTAAIIIITLSPLLAKSISLSRENYIQDAQYSLDKNALLLQNTMKEVYQLSAKMDELIEYRKLKLYHGTSLELEHYPRLYMAQKFMEKQISTLEFATEIFVYLSNNSVTLGKKRVFETIDSYLRFDLEYENYSPEEIKNWLNENSYFGKILPMTPTKIYGGKTKNCLTMAIGRPTDSAVIGAVFTEETVLDLFGIPNLPEDSFLLITDGQGNSSFRYQFEGAPPSHEASTMTYQGGSYSLLRTAVSLPACQITLGVPDSYFEELYAPLHGMISRYFWISIGLAVITSGLFALFSYLPMRKLSKTISGDREQQSWWVAKEYGEISSHILESSDQISSLQSNLEITEENLRESTFSRLLFGAVYTAEEYAFASQVMPLLTEPYRASLLQIDPGSEMIEALTEDFSIYDYLKRKLNNQFYINRIDSLLFAILLPDTSQALTTLKQMVAHMNDELSAQSGFVTLGVSGTFSGSTNVHHAYDRAKFSLQQAEAKQVQFYTEPFEEKTNESVDLYEIQRLSGLLLSREMDSFLEGLELQRNIMTKNAILEREDIAQFFYVIRFTIETDLLRIGADTKLLKKLTYQSTEPIDTMFVRICQTAWEIIDMLAENEDDTAKRVARRVTTYLEENFTDPNLYAESIADALSLSRNQVFRSVREVTGKSLNEYIEHLRMEQALKYLTQTEMTVSEIAKACGYNSSNTFYKVFRKNFGAPPSMYRQ